MPMIYFSVLTFFSIISSFDCKLCQYNPQFAKYLPDLLLLHKLKKNWLLNDYCLVVSTQTLSEYANVIAMCDAQPIKSWKWVATDDHGCFLIISCCFRLNLLLSLLLSGNGDFFSIFSLCIIDMIQVYLLKWGLTSSHIQSCYFLCCALYLFFILTSKISFSYPYQSLEFFFSFVNWVSRWLIVILVA